MARKRGYEKIITALPLLLLLGCSARTSSVADVDHAKLRGARSGDVICRLGNGYFSDIFRKMASQEKIYSHIGIVEKSGDSVFVYHTEASELTGIGHVRRESLDVFLDGINVFELFHVEAPDSVRSEIVKYAQGRFEARTEFDLNFDLANDDKLYCTELVANAINRAVGAYTICPTLFLGGKLIYSLEDIYKSDVISARNETAQAE